jgi:hypothetical protein
VTDCSSAGFPLRSSYLQSVSQLSVRHFRIAPLCKLIDRLCQLSLTSLLSSACGTFGVVRLLVQSCFQSPLSVPNYSYALCETSRASNRPTGSIQRYADYYVNLPPLFGTVRKTYLFRLSDALQMSPPPAVDLAQRLLFSSFNLHCL